MGGCPPHSRQPSFSVGFRGKPTISLRLSSFFFKKTTLSGDFSHKNYLTKRDACRGGTLWRPLPRWAPQTAAKWVQTPSPARSPSPTAPAFRSAPPPRPFTGKKTGIWGRERPRRDPAEGPAVMRPRTRRDPGGGRER